MNQFQFLFQNNLFLSSKDKEVSCIDNSLFRLPWLKRNSAALLRQQCFFVTTQAHKERGRGCSSLVALLEREKMNEYQKIPCLPPWPGQTFLYLYFWLPALFQLIFQPLISVQTSFFSSARQTSGLDYRSLLLTSPLERRSESKSGKRRGHKPELSGGHPTKYSECAPSC